MMTPHGPDNKTFVRTSQEELKPVKVEETMVCCNGNKIHTLNMLYRSIIVNTAVVESVISSRLFKLCVTGPVRIGHRI